jgi:xanthine/CO dehydrogenase XdhC/CoxF family maturation factor
MAVEARKLVKLWADARAAGEECALATVVRVAGSSYRKPGARMMITRGGQRAGTVSGGCLEAEVARKIWWLTANGPIVKDYSTSYDDDSQPSYGLGCDGIVSLLLERASQADAVFEALRKSVDKRTSSIIVTVIDTDSPRVPLGGRLTVSQSQIISCNDEIPTGLQLLLLPIALNALQEEHSTATSVFYEGRCLEIFAEYVSPPPALFVFGAGDDAQPVVHLATAMGWEVTVADGRSNLATPARFPAASRTAVLDLDRPLQDLPIVAGDAAVVMTHSYRQDVAILRELLPLQLAYLGVLGPKRRTTRIVNEVADFAGVDRAEALNNLKSPVGLDLGAGTPEIIALSIVSEIQAVLTRRSAAPLHLAAQAEMPLSSAIHE